MGDHVQGRSDKDVDVLMPMERRRDYRISNQGDFRGNHSGNDGRETRQNHYDRHCKTPRTPLGERARLIADYEQEQRWINEEIIGDAEGIVYKEGSSIEGWDRSILERKQKEMGIMTTCANSNIQIPYPIETFSQLDISREIGCPDVDIFEGIQRQCLPIIRLGYDAWVKKDPGSLIASCCYVVPAIEVALRERVKRGRRRNAGPFVLIMVTQQEQAEELAAKINQVAPPYITVWSPSQQSRKLETNIDIAVSTLGKILCYADPSDRINEALLRFSDVALFILDETVRFNQSAWIKRQETLPLISAVFKQPHQTLILVSSKCSEAKVSILKSIFRKSLTVEIKSKSVEPLNPIMPYCVRHKIKYVKDELGMNGLCHQLVSVLRSSGETGPRLVFANNTAAVQHIGLYLRNQGITNIFMLYYSVHHNEQYRIVKEFQDAGDDSTAVFVTTDMLDQENKHSQLVINVDAPYEQTWYREDYTFRAAKITPGGAEKRGRVVTILYNKDQDSFHQHLVKCLKESDLTKRIPKRLRHLLPASPSQKSHESFVDEESSSSDSSSESSESSSSSRWQHDLYPSEESATSQAGKRTNI